MAQMVYSNLTRQSLFSQSSVGNTIPKVREKVDRLTRQSLAGVIDKSSSVVDRQNTTLAESQEIERAFNAIAAALRTLEIDANMIESCLSRLSPAEDNKITTHLQQLKHNRQKTHDLHFHYTELCLASSQKHFTNGISPRERQLADRIMKLRERTADLINTCHDLLTKYQLLGKVELPKDCSKSLAAIKNLGNVLTEVFGGSFKFFSNGFRVEAEQTIYIERTGEIYVTNVEQLKNSLIELRQRLAQVTEGRMLVQNQAAQKLEPRFQVG